MQKKMDNIGYRWNRGLSSTCRKVPNSKGGEAVKLIGWFGYQFRELLLEIRGWLLDHPVDRCMKIIDWLDNKESVSYWRKKDRGI